MLGVRATGLTRSRPRYDRGMSGYLLPFEVISVHLVGGARRRRLLGSARAKRAAEEQARRLRSVAPKSACQPITLTLSNRYLTAWTFSINLSD